MPTDADGPGKPGSGHHAGNACRRPSSPLCRRHPPVSVQKTRRPCAAHRMRTAGSALPAEPVEEKDISTLVAAAMEKPAASEQAAAAAPVDETEPVDTYQYQYPPIELFEKSQDETDPGAQEELKGQRPEAGGYAGKLWRAHPCAGYLPGPLRYPVRGAAHGGRQDQPHHLAGGRYRPEPCGGGRAYGSAHPRQACRRH